MREKVSQGLGFWGVELRLGGSGDTDFMPFI